MPSTTFRGLELYIENPKGSKRPWKADDGTIKYTTMKYPYGYVKNSEGVDGDEVDVYVGPDEDAANVYVVRQMKKPDFKQFDENKVMIGFAKADDAKAAYLAHYTTPGFFGGMKELAFEDFVTALDSRFGKKLAQMQRLAGLRLVVRDKLAQDRSRFDRLADRVDDVGIATLAAPYAAKGIANTLEHRPGALGTVGRGARAAADWMHKHENKLELAGLAAVAPSITHRAAHTLEKLPTKEAAFHKYAGEHFPTYWEMSEAEKVAFVKALIGGASKAYQAGKGMLSGARASMSMNHMPAHLKAPELPAPVAPSRMTYKARVQRRAGLDTPTTAPAAPVPTPASAALNANPQQTARISKDKLRQRSAAPTTTSAAPTQTPTTPTAPAALSIQRPKILGAGNIAKAGLVGAGGLALYGGYRGIGAAADLAKEREAPAEMPSFQGPLVR